ncbi:MULTISPECIES: hypothetical protein [Haemophilus]|uniref:Uncharacterized protein n=1 Tax=Haemophilus aegyptius TaxID=197575 RepID=A0ABY1VW72_HAEAE|nr:MULTISPECIES: hypothetical protein [Haemophilus]EGF17711.1 hypothetical protein HMPREF9095_0547 [Haemophilus aegyptius ATCC 11116]OBX84278.1 hypothetical protein A9520_09020 [Haemophilus aegyptius]TMQ43885.1 hypothetical protein AO054_04565 [Haemophilus influenzae biotype aegyptius]UAK82643.1 hypothetical protein K8O83_00265 [Haemophilus aegyptius]UAK83432.1 hypothetical protein K8O83_04725 [Haemophilus aegyptius]
MSIGYELEHQFDEIQSSLGGLHCLRQLLEITDNTADTLSYSQLAGMIAVFTAALDCQVSTVRQLVKELPIKA